MVDGSEGIWPSTSSSCPSPCNIQTHSQFGQNAPSIQSDWQKISLKMPLQISQSQTWFLLLIITLVPFIFRAHVEYRMLNVEYWISNIEYRILDIIYQISNHADVSHTLWCVIEINRDLAKSRNLEAMIIAGQVSSALSCLRFHLLDHTNSQLIFDFTIRPTSQSICQEMNQVPPKTTLTESPSKPCSTVLRPMKFTKFSFHESDHSHENAFLQDIFRMGETSEFSVSSTIPWICLVQ
jgi:hypothetical protein